MQLFLSFLQSIVLEHDTSADIPKPSLIQSAVGPAAQSSHIQAGISTPQLSRNYEPRG